MILKKEHINAILFGVAVGDALGVPVEFKSREYLKRNPVNDMLGYGTHNQPKGTWSDDSSMTFCLAETLLDSEFATRKLANRFINWMDAGFWTPHGHVFDIGNTTRTAIDNLRTIDNPEDAGGMHETDNGNGSLMRILPLVVCTMHLSLEELYKEVRKVSSLTHAHMRSVNCCFYYIVFARQLIYGHPCRTAYEITNNIVNRILHSNNTLADEIQHLGRLLSGSIADLKEDDIRGSGYVVQSLEASLWCLLTTKSYEDAVLKAIHLGEDTDTTGAITGGISALHFGFNSIPVRWIKALARKEDIESLADKIGQKYVSSFHLSEIPELDDMTGAMDFSHKHFKYLSSVDETSRVSLEVRRKIENEDTENLKVGDIGTCLFFYFRAIRHVGEEPNKEWVNTLLALMRKQLKLEEHVNEL